MSDSLISAKSMAAVKQIFRAARVLVAFDQEGYANKKKRQSEDILQQRQRSKSLAIMLCGGTAVGGLFVCPISWAVTFVVVATQCTKVLMDQQGIITATLANRQIEAAKESARKAEQQRIFSLIEHKFMAQVFAQSNPAAPNKDDLFAFLRTNAPSGIIQDDVQGPSIYKSEHGSEETLVSSQENVPAT
jgi:hypothetical protein